MPCQGFDDNVEVVTQSDCAFAHLKLRRLVGGRGALRILDLVLRMICRCRNTKALHLVKQGGALQAKSGSCPSRTSELPIGALASGENFSPHLVFKRRV